MSILERGLQSVRWWCLGGKSFTFSNDAVFGPDFSDKLQKLVSKFRRVSKKES